MKYNSVLELIGNTPIIKLDEEITGIKNIEVWVKCELFNPFGSVKDRAAYQMYLDAKEELDKMEDPTIIEASSGNTAKALNIIAGMHGVKFETITNRIKIPETRNILKALGAKIEELPGESECSDPTNPNDPVTYIERKIAKEKGYYHTSQYTNLSNPKAHYMHTGPEIVNDIGNVDYFFGTLGTTGHSRGTIEYLLTVNENLRKVGIIAKTGDLVPGIRNEHEMLEVGIFEKKLYDDIVKVSAQESVEMMTVLNNKVGILGGPTSGCAMAGTLRYLKEEDEKIEEEKKNNEELRNKLENEKLKAVFIACDRMEGYLSYIEKYKPELFKITGILSSEKQENMVEENIYTFDMEKEENKKHIKEVTSEELLQKIEEKENGKANNLIIIDTRGNLAYKNTKIKGSINITDIFLEEIIDNGVPFTEENEVILICINGEKTKKLSAYLNKNGMNVYSLKGGLLDWKEKGYKLERKMIKLR